MQTKVNTNWFKQQLAARNMSMRELARRMKLEASSVSLTLRGLRRMTPEEAQQISALLSVPVTEVLRQAGVPITEDVHSVKLAGTIDCDGFVHDIAKPSKITVPSDVPADGFALQVRCPQGLNDAWLVLCAGQSLQAESAVERLCVVHLGDGSRVLGILKRGYEPGTFNVVRTVPHGPVLENQDVVGANAVLWLRPR
ncbi:MAG: Serratia phage Parlo [Pseudomonadota bacterium]|jgi:transcriptional regulator with XRE-family HTH domain